MQITDRRAVPEATGPSGRLTFKTAENVSGQMIALDDAEGIVTAVVSVTGTEDEVADIIVPGAYRETLSKRRPKVCWAHSWEHPIGRVLHIEELMPGDDRLPTEDKDGNPWPAEAGALVATMQFNMRTREGKDAFEAVRFYSETGECEYSIGYQVPAGKATKDRNGVRHIKALDLYELSVVLFGAHTKTGTLSIKAALAQITERKTAKGSGTVGTRRTTAKDALARIKAASKAAPPFTAKPEPAEPTVADNAAATPADAAAEKAAPDFSDSVMVAVYPDPEAADKLAAAIAGPDETTPREQFHVTLAYLGKADSLSMDSDEVVRRVTEAVEGENGLRGTLGGLGIFPADDDNDGEGAPVWVPVDVPGLSMLRETIAAALGDAVATDHGFTPHMTIGWGLGMIDPIEPIPVTFTQVSVVYGQTTRTIPLGSVPAEDEDYDEKSRASRGRNLDTLPLSEVVRLTAIESLLTDGPQVKAGGADRNRGGAEELRRYWTTGAGGAKIAWGTSGDFTRCVKYLSEHMTPERAKGYCANRHKETTGMWPGDKDNKASAYDPSLDAGAPTETKGPGPAIEGGKGYPRLPGSVEERMDAIHAAVREALRGEPVDEAENRWEWDYVCIDATFEDSVIATRQKWDTDDHESFEVTYEWDPLMGGVSLGEPDRVELQVVALGRDTDAGEVEEVMDLDVMPLAEDVEQIVHAFKAAAGDRVETKAGRVLSARNERALRLAVENLVNVLAAAGVNIEVTETREDDYPGDSGTDQPTARAGDTRKPVRPGVDMSTTSPSASVKDLRSGEQVAIDWDEHRRLLAELEAVAGTD